MKRIYCLICFAAVLLTASSCHDWLEATSSTKIPASKMFETRGGFCDALTGIYISMGDGSCYGGGFTWNANDLTSYPYEYLQSYAAYRNIQTHNYSYSLVQSNLEDIWQQGYYTIANINLMLRELEAQEGVITSEAEYNLFKGELLGLRAYIHFDMMRMFGLGSWDGENAAKLTIPYVTEYYKEPTAQLSYEATSALLMQDINGALDCLCDSDPITGNQPENFDESINEDGFWDNRTKHLNYYAAEALAARVYLWMGDHETAASYAQDVIDGALGRGEVSWLDAETIINVSSDDERDWTFSAEHVFSLEITELYDLLSSLYFNSLTAGLTLGNELVDNILYPRIDSQTGSVAGAEDVRGPALLLKYGAWGYTNYKFYSSSNYNTDFKERMPMIRISEMYYILAEHCLETDNDAGALEAINTVRRHRGISEELSSGTDLEAELEKEYYREFAGEGQIFYYIKRKALQSSILSTFTVTADDLIYPYPQDEIDYGRVQEL